MPDETSISADLLELYEAARAASVEAYVPYSQFRVGAAVRTVGGQVFSGCNVENASFGLTVCAERNALTTAVAAGARDFDAIAVHVDHENGSPCGACRQFLSEFAPDMPVVYRRGGELVERTVRELLPDTFVPSDIPSAR